MEQGGNLNNYNSMQMNYVQKQSKLDIVALIISIISLCTCSSCLFGGILGIVLSTIVIRDNTGKFPNKNKAYIGLGLSILSILALFTVIFLASNSMPDVTGQKLDEAKLSIENTKDSIKIVEQYEFNDEVEKGNIIRSDPKSGKLLSNNDVVTLYVSRGKAIIVPDCINKNRADIVTELNKLGLVINETSEFSEDIKKET